MRLTKTNDVDSDYDDLLDDDNEIEDLDLDDNFDSSLSDYGDSLTTAEKHNDLLKDLTEFDDFLKIKVTEWLGLVWNEKHKKYILDKSVEPIMNLTGARWCVNFLRVYCRKNNIITTLDQQSYKFMMADIIKVANINIGTRAEEFAIKSDAEILTVCDQLEHSAQLILIGTGGANNYQKMLQTTIQRNESVNTNNSSNQQNQPIQTQSYLQKFKKITGL